ncbi:cytochrome P450 76T24-like [Cornus florida]|uniref:cytochrome P450 76T24-like n=1 Tax=Cornus florida TaxID=4283 RepID=UPI00289BFEF4|nr:cytochrome P450 76T24-like [Cornus florida]
MPMDYITFFLVLALSFVSICIHILVSNPIFRRSSTARLPPGPYAFPVIGNFLALGNKPHESLATLSKTYGPIMSLKLGSITTIVVSSPKIAKEVLQKHDLNISSRIIPDSVKVLDHSIVSIVWLPASNQWRKLRKICKEYLFSAQVLDSSQGLRRKKVRELVDYVHESCTSGQAVDIGRAAFTTSLNLLANTFFSIDLAHYQANSSQEFKDIVSTVMDLVGKTNVADYFPLLKLIDPQHFRRQMKFYFGKLLEIFEAIINQRLQSRASSSGLGNDVLGTLLNQSKDNDTEGFSINDLKHLLLDLFLAGTDTTSASVEWAMAELMKRPDAMAKARNELEEVIGRDGHRLVQESDIPTLPYLQAVVKESLRLHPVAPLLIPHKAEADVEICGYTVPKNAQVLVNVWAMGRDPNIWSNPNSFLPERFLEHETDFRGQDFELIPFGAGRRVCPGMALGSRMLHFMLASLLQSFDWKLEEGVKPEDIDMNDKTGLTMQKAMPLKAIAIKL